MNGAWGGKEPKGRGSSRPLFIGPSNKPQRGWVLPEAIPTRGIHTDFEAEKPFPTFSPMGKKVLFPANAKAALLKHKEEPALEPFL